MASITNRQYAAGQQVMLDGAALFTFPSAGTHLVTLPGDDFAYAPADAGTPSGAAETRAVGAGATVSVDGHVLATLQPGRHVLGLPGPDVVFDVATAPTPAPPPTPDPTGRRIVQ